MITAGIMLIQVLVGEMIFQHARLVSQHLFVITEAHGEAVFHGQDVLRIQLDPYPQVAVQEGLILFDHPLSNCVQAARGNFAARYPGRSFYSHHIGGDRLAWLDAARGDQAFPQHFAVQISRRER